MSLSEDQVAGEEEGKAYDKWNKEIHDAEGYNGSDRIRIGQ